MKKIQILRTNATFSYSHRGKNNIIKVPNNFNEHKISV